MIPYGRQSISTQDIDAVVDVLKSDFLTQGPQVPLFEQKISALVDSQYAIAVNSATSALHIACLALDVKKGDIVWTSPISFVASANCALYCDAEVNFVDIDLDTGNMSIDALTHQLEMAARQGNLPKVLIPVHLSGQSCDMQAIAGLATKYGFNVIEDASHCIGGQFQNFPIGNCQYSDICIFSFHPVKIVTSAEGGIATTNNSELAEKMDLLRSHGITKDPGLMTKATEGLWYYQQLMLGFNYRMTELQAALGCSQLEQLTDFVKQRNMLRKRYDSAFANIAEVTPLKIADNCYSSCHLYIIKVDAGIHDQLFAHLREHKIGVNLHYIPIYQQPYFEQLNMPFNDCPNAEQYYRSAISIPLFAQLTLDEQDHIIETIRAYLCK